MNDKKPTRKNIRLKNYDYSSCGAYFATICTKEKQNYFWNNAEVVTETLQEVELSENGKIVEDAINNISKIYPNVLVDQYVIMTDHIHIILIIDGDKNGLPMAAPTLSRIIGQMKGYVTKKLGVPIWQKSFYDHVIRNQKDYEAHLKYIYENPIGLSYKKKDMRF